MRVRCDKGVVLRPGVKMAFGTLNRLRKKSFSIKDRNLSG